MAIGLGGPPLFLRPGNENEFVVERAPSPTTIRFSMRSDSATGFAIDLGGERDTFERFDTARPLDDVTRRSMSWAWYSDELDVTWAFSVDSSNGRLMLQMPRRPATPVQPLLGNMVRAGPYLITIERNSGGAVAAFTISAGRAKGMRSFARDDQRARRPRFQPNP